MPVLRQALTVLLALLTLSGCTSILRLNLSYTLPEEKGLSKGTLSVEVIDRRGSQAILTEKAAEGLGRFSKDMQLSLATPGSKKGFLLGTYEVPEAFRTAFMERLKAAGVSTGQASEYGLVIEIHEFLVDIVRISLVEKRWNVKISYEATLMKGKTPLYTQFVRADSEKLRLYKDMGLDDLASEAFTQAINTFDMKEALFKIK